MHTECPFGAGDEQITSCTNYCTQDLPPQFISPENDFKIGSKSTNGICDDKRTSLQNRVRDRAANALREHRRQYLVLLEDGHTRVHNEPEFKTKNSSHLDIEHIFLNIFN